MSASRGDGTTHRYDPRAARARAEALAWVATAWRSEQVLRRLERRGRGCTPR
jgi:hypothetical protein